MRLGLSMSCFRWEVYPTHQRTSQGYLAAGNPPLFFSSVPTALPLDQGGLEWLIDYCAEQHLSALYMSAERLQDAVFAAGIRDRAREKGVELIMAAEFDWVTSGDAAAREREAFARWMEVSKRMGIRIVNATHSNAHVTNHYSRDPPIARQIECMIGNFTVLAELAEEMGLVISIENHNDYRCSELVQVLEAVASPALRANFDTGNPVTVIEDPLEAARTFAPYAVKAHLKDFRVFTTSNADTAMKVFHSPTGMGDLDLAGMLEVLQTRAPEPADLPLCIETIPPLDVDPGLWVGRCISNAREMFSKYLV